MSLRARKLLAYSACLAVLLGVFALYIQPTMLATLADQLWACFN